MRSNLESVTSDGVEVPAFSFAVGPIVKDILLLLGAKPQRGLLGSPGDRIAGTSAADGNVQRQGVGWNSAVLVMKMSMRFACGVRRKRGRGTSRRVTCEKGGRERMRDTVSLRNHGDEWHLLQPCT